MDDTVWGIHAGRTGDADLLFLRQNFIAIGWHAMGDLSTLAAEREAFKQCYVQAYPDAKKGGIATVAGVPYRFLHEMKIGDLVAYPSKQDKHIHIGRVEGEYRYEPSGENSYPHRRKVEWLKHVPRLDFTQGALYEVGSALSLFQIRNYADELRAVLEGRTPAVVAVDQDSTVSAVAEDIEDTTRDFVLKRLAQELKGLPLEGFVAHLLQCMGYHARQTRKNEPSVDVIAHKDHLGIEPPIIKVQVKSSPGTATDKDVSALYGKLSNGEYGLFVTLGTFSPASRTFEQSKPNLRLIDGDELVELIFAHYEQFDSRHKGLLPLRRIYVPQVLDSE
ncbi:restriction endonuclease [Xanthomonas campestris pv. campestris]|jgi:restriction system protein|uniref:restriction endonuclease n=1 Tax=Xanthomonas campestris TaxID=339 RepID=UPI002AD2FE24|nr:restriction endonuclease [Xanthomonas campestris]MEA0738321.1 restriction endonuclease [Xanthomonas campestris pv. campestris]